MSRPASHPDKMRRLLKALRHSLAAAFLVSSSTLLAQIEIEVIDLSNGRNIPARISLISDNGSSEYVGNTTEQSSLKVDAECEGQVFEAKLLYPFWQYNSVEERRKKCEPGKKVPIYFRPIGYRSAGLVAPTSSADLTVFSTIPTVSSGIRDLEQSINRGEFAEISVKAKKVAEELERIESQKKAEEYWLLSAQSAIAAMSQLQGKDQVKVWVQPTANAFDITPEGREVILGYQIQNNLRPIGSIDEETFTALESTINAPR